MKVQDCISFNSLGCIARICALDSGPLGSIAHICVKKITSYPLNKTTVHITCCDVHKPNLLLRLYIEPEHTIICVGDKIAKECSCIVLARKYNIIFLLTSYIANNLAHDGQKKTRTQYEKE